MGSPASLSRRSSRRSLSPGLGWSNIARFMFFASRRLGTSRNNPPTLAPTGAEPAESSDSTALAVRPAFTAISVTVRRSTYLSRSTLRWAESKTKGPRDHGGCLGRFERFDRRHIH